MEWFLTNIELTVSIGGIVIALSFLSRYKLEAIEITGNLLSLFSGKFKFIIKFRNELDNLHKELPKLFPITLIANFDRKMLKDGPTPRNGVLESWKRLHATLEKGNALYNKKAPTTVDAQQTVNLLCSDRAINPVQAESIVNLYNLGKGFNDNQNWNPEQKSAWYYQQATDKIVKWLEKQLKPKPPAEPPRKTTIDSHFDPSASGDMYPVAFIKGIKGQVQGKKFKVDKELFYLGANAENDVVLSNDDYVSGNHALLHFLSDTLFLLDQHSRNGTFLNGKQLADKALPVNIGDEIRIGKSTFKVTDQ